MLEQEQAWADVKATPSPLLSKNRYFIVNTFVFNNDIQAALNYVYGNWQSFRFKKKAAGALILSDTDYLFFTYDLPKD